MRKVSYIGDIDKWKEGFVFSIDVPIRFSETDMFGHVNNISPFIYFEQARIDYLKNVGLFTTLEGEGSIPIVADLQCDYIKEIFFGETLRVFVKTAFVGNSSLDIHYMGINKTDKSICLTGRGRLVNVDSLTGKPIPLTELQKRKLLDYVH